MTSPQTVVHFIQKLAATFSRDSIAKVHRWNEVIWEISLCYKLFAQESINLSVSNNNQLQSDY